ncbi:hypothetical protein GSB9_03156 [Flavobacteriaceae bacterium GSB9]|nr:hypothetical protein GSB9_03156 [Flavobacteriaceae bacterium GSB9]
MKTTIENSKRKSKSKTSNKPKLKNSREADIRSSENILYGGIVLPQWVDLNDDFLVPIGISDSIYQPREGIFPNPSEYVYSGRLNYPRSASKATPAGKFCLGLALGKKIIGPSIDFGYDNNVDQTTTVSSEIKYEFGLKRNRTYNISSLFNCITDERNLQLYYFGESDTPPYRVNPGGSLKGRVWMIIELDGREIYVARSPFLYWKKQYQNNVDIKEILRSVNLNYLFNNRDSRQLTVTYRVEIQAIEHTYLNDNLLNNNTDRQVFIGCNFTDSEVYNNPDMGEIAFLFDMEGKPEFHIGILNINNVQLLEV